MRAIHKATLLSTGRLFGPSAIRLDETCPDGKVVVGGRELNEDEIAALAWATKDAEVTVRFIRGDQFSGLDLPLASAFYMLTARHSSVFSTQPVRFIYTEHSGGKQHLRLLNFKVSVLPRLRGRGVSTIALGRQIRAAETIGFHTIEAAVAGHPTGALNGYCVWPRLGYGGNIPSDILDNLPVAELKALGFEASQPIDVRELCSTQEGWNLWVAHGKGFPMKFDLSPADIYAKMIVNRIEEVGL